MKHFKEESGSYPPVKISSLRIGANGEPCPYCTRIMVLGDPKLTPTKDHIKPVSRFGPGRKLMVCYECNSLKGAKTLEEFLQWLKKQETEMLLLHNRLTMIDYLVKTGLS